MEINLEAREPHAIRSYDETHLVVDEITYTKSVIICRQEIINPWSLQSLKSCSLKDFEPLVALKPEVIVLGHSQTCIQLPPSILQELSQLQIGAELMSIGAACRTFNILLNENRNVVLGIIFNS